VSDRPPILPSRIHPTRLDSKSATVTYRLVKYDGYDKSDDYYYSNNSNMPIVLRVRQCRPKWILFLRDCIAKNRVQSPKRSDSTVVLMLPQIRRQQRRSLMSTPHRRDRCITFDATNCRVRFRLWSTIAFDYNSATVRYRLSSVG